MVGQRNPKSWLFTGLPFLGLLLYLCGGSLRMRPGEQCVLARTSYGIRDLDKARNAFQKARTAGDEIGLAELIDREDAVPIPQGTFGLVIDSSQVLLNQYRQIRVLGGLYKGKAFWIKSSDLDTAPTPTVQSQRPETCHDPHEYRGSSGICWCEDGYTRDVSTQKCVQVGAQ